MTNSRQAATPEAPPEWAIPASMIGLILAGLIVTFGTLWAFERSAPDFTVFYSAWHLVLEGRGSEIYRESPDRFLYAPGFAWLLAPLAGLPRGLALALWCFSKAAVVGFLVREFRPLRRWGAASIGMAAWGVTLLARPILIDFQYGQVNILILGACCWALLGHFRGDQTKGSAFVSWMILAIAAVAKIFPLPLLAVPWLARGVAPPARLRWERAGLLVGIVVVFALPLISLSPPQAGALLGEWRDALISRGLPFESHNQSFSALLHRWFSGELVHVVALGMVPIHMGWPLLCESTLRLLSMAWILMSAGGLLAWLMRAGQPTPLRWIAVLVALLILPSHLVWKPYFVMFLPVGILVAASQSFTPRRVVLVALAFIAMNVLGFDLLGPDWGARTEAASEMLWAALIYLAVCATDSETNQSVQPMP